MSATHILVTLSFIFTTAAGLKCHIVPSGNISNPVNSSPEECPLGSLACVKIVDYTHLIYTKQCQPANCTSTTITPAPANCFNTSSNGVILATCCCYGDGQVQLDANRSPPLSSRHSSSNQS
ncbi:unnamed protein product [Caenorhabditis auriculariae]|uniref:Uncharacterized protein n=1 Tax=Caenorhabditis auriculariae TaxID=2777116 RepID=A0A8S1GTV0_9PELO|nr:unnamed protein product [Caenorhabditis auriculariae]